jgi:Immunity protein 51
MDEFAPTKLVEHTLEGASSRYSIILDPFGPIYLTTSSIFEAHGLEASGYAWHGVAEALVRLHAPEVANLVKYDPESSMFSAYGNDRDALLRVAQLIREAQNNSAVLEEALENANPEMLD